VPAAWQPGEEVQVEVRCARPGGAPLPGHAVELRLGEERIALTTGEDGTARVTRAFAAEAELRVRARAARAEGLAAGEAEAVLRIADYRKEAGRAYDALVQRARAHGLRLRRAPSPRELQRALLGASPDDDLEGFVRAFERATYSPRAFDRAAFVGLAQAQARLLARLAPAPPPRAGGERPAPA
jgi:hypothetical protein